MIACDFCKRTPVARLTHGSWHVALRSSALLLAAVVHCLAAKAQTDKSCNTLIHAKVKGQCVLHVMFNLLKS
jgi:hypothetical protein